MSWRMNFFQPPKSSGPNYVKDGLVLWLDGIWNAGEGVHDPNATEWKDLSGNGHDAILARGVAAWTNDEALFDGQSAMTVDMSEYVVPFDGDNVTMEILWTQVVSGDINTPAALVSNRSPAISLFSDRGKNVLWKTEWKGSQSTINRGAISTAIQLSMSGGRTYVNGLYVTEVIPPAPKQSQSLACIIGDRSASGYRALHGTIYSVRIYNRALTAEEIAQNYAVDKERFSL